MSATWYERVVEANRREVQRLKAQAERKLAEISVTCSTCGRIWKPSVSSACPACVPGSAHPIILGRTQARMDQVTELLTALGEPLGLPGSSLPAYGIPGDGCCRDCLRPPVYSQGLCVYCGEVAARTPASRDRIVHWTPFLFVLAVALALYGTIGLFWALGAIQ